MENLDSPVVSDGGSLAESISNLEKRISDQILLAVNCFGDSEAESNIPSHVQVWISKILEDRSLAEMGDDLSDMGQDEDRGAGVEVVDSSVRKAFLGGYVHRGTGAEYHDACSQTQPPDPGPGTTTHRTTQTYTWRDQGQNTLSTRSMQTLRSDLHSPWAGDRLVSPQPYTTADEAERKMTRLLTEKATVIQKYFRGWLGRRYLDQLREKKRRREELERRELQLKQRERELVLKRNVIAVTYPKNKQDFEMLYAILEKWRQDQVARAEQMATGAGRKAMLWFLLKKQLQLMSRIEQLWRQAVAEEARKPRLLDATTEVRRWTGYKRLAVSMETLEVQQAWQLRELHRALGEDLASGERAELLVCLRQAFSHLGGGSARELVRLLDRECHFLAMGLGAPRLAGLRARIEQVFLDVVRDPRVNPQVATLRAAEQGRVPQRDVVRCDRCLKFKHYSKFPLGNLTKMVSCCSACQWLEVAGRTRVDLGPYRNIARAVRRDEQRQAAYCSVAFVMSDDDFYLLVDNIWQGHSAISSSGDLKLLRLCRWDTESLWSPWNCILLTADEAKAHCSSNSSPGEIYEDNFKEKVIHRHAIAKLQFKHLARHDQACLDTQETVGID
ncbi:IQ and ubiquitin-like domain-containing protein [Bacillus rossius redtenbacheri]|uniref:IQ and ubiquitin-like domain-containing protein n=1 Tax=Bacillus rossius redtenbacheri TaxID=93214 RepID=UPI002FDED911